MRRRTHLAITLLALVMVGSSLVTTSPRDLAQASDPLADAKLQQQALERAIAQQRDQLSQLRATSAALSAQLDAAEAELAAVSAEYDRVAALLVQVQGQVADITARLKDLNQQIAVRRQDLAQAKIELAALISAPGDVELLLRELEAGGRRSCRTTCARPMNGRRPRCWRSCSPPSHSIQPPARLSTCSPSLTRIVSSPTRSRPCAPSCRPRSRRSVTDVRPWHRPATPPKPKRPTSQTARRSWPICRRAWPS